MVHDLFTKSRPTSDQTPVEIRWVEASFPWTGPSFELEIMHDGKWLELLGSGVMQQSTLERSKVGHKSGWAFGIGLERIAMVMFGIPDIRLFWSTDPRFMDQFEDGKISQFKPYSKYPEAIRDISFWLPLDPENSTSQSYHDNDFMDLIRDIAGDLCENVTKTDEFSQGSTGRRSKTFRIKFQSMDRSLTGQDVSEKMMLIEGKLKADGLEVR